MPPGVDEMRRQILRSEMDGSAGSPSEPVARLVRLDQPSSKPPVSVSRPITVIGSKEEADIYLHSRQVSGAHCILVNLGQTLLLRDLGSRTGVFVNDQRVQEAELLQGDTLMVGRFQYSVDYGRPTERAPRAAAPSNATLRSSTSIVPVNRTTFLIGRHRSADLHLENELVSKAHALLVHGPEYWLLCDLCSRTGTRVNGQVVEICALHNGDSIEIGDEQFAFGAEPPELETIADNSLPSEAAPVPDVTSHARAAVEESQPDGPALSEIPSAVLGDGRTEDSVAPPRRPLQPGMICRGWGPLAAAVAEPALLERIAASRRRAPLPGQQAPSPQAPAQATGPAAHRVTAPRFVAIALAAVTCLGAAWFVISHPHFFTQLW